MTTGPVATHPYLDWPGPAAFAHRGGAGDHPENTMPAFGHAVALGYRYVETDVHLTADGQVVAFHDDRLDRVTDGHGLVASLPWSEVRQARVAGTEPIPLLTDLLTTWPDVRINIDAKHDAVVGPLAEVLQRHHALDRVCVASFSDRRLRALRASLGPGLCTAMGPRAIAAWRARAWGAPLPSRSPARCIQVPVRQGRITLVDERTVAAAHRRGLAVHVWTVDDPQEMDRLLDLGVDGLMTDRPEVLKNVLVARHQWVS